MRGVRGRQEGEGQVTRVEGLKGARRRADQELICFAFPLESWI